jgi:hypothetical protein
MPYPDLLEKLREEVGAKNVFTGEKKTAYYRSGFRSGLGSALAGNLSRDPPPAMAHLTTLRR